jgi:hypothetical protein
MTYIHTITDWPTCAMKFLIAAAAEPGCPWASLLCRRKQCTRAAPRHAQPPPMQRCRTRGWRVPAAEWAEVGAGWVLQGVRVHVRGGGGRVSPLSSARAAVGVFPRPPASSGAPAPSTRECAWLYACASMRVRVRARAHACVTSSRDKTSFLDACISISALAFAASSACAFIAVTIRSASSRRRRNSSCTQSAAFGLDRQRPVVWHYNRIATHARIVATDCNCCGHDH